MIQSRLVMVPCILVSMCMAPGCVERQKAQATAPKPIQKTPDVVYVPTPQEVVERMLELAEVKKGDVVYDLGCGDGRVLVTAAKKYGVKAVGCDVDPERIEESLENIKKHDVGHLVTVTQADLFEVDLSQATVVTLYLLPELNVRLMPRLSKLKPGTRIVSHAFDMRGTRPDQTITFTAPETRHEYKLYLWVTPFKTVSSG